VLNEEAKNKKKIGFYSALHAAEFLFSSSSLCFSWLCLNTLPQAYLLPQEGYTGRSTYSKKSGWLFLKQALKDKLSFIDMIICVSSSSSTNSVVSANIF